MHFMAMLVICRKIMGICIKSLAQANGVNVGAFDFGQETVK